MKYLIFIVWFGVVVCGDDTHNDPTTTNSEWMQDQLHENDPPQQRQLRRIVFRLQSLRSFIIQHLREVQPLPQQVTEYLATAQQQLAEFAKNDDVQIAHTAANYHLLVTKILQEDQWLQRKNQKIDIKKVVIAALEKNTQLEDLQTKVAKQSQEFNKKNIEELEQKLTSATQVLQRLKEQFATAQNNLSHFTSTKPQTNDDLEKLQVAIHDQSSSQPQDYNNGSEALKLIESKLQDLEKKLTDFKKKIDDKNISNELFSQALKTLLMN